MEWEILLTEGVETFLDALYATDRDSHRLVNQASSSWNATARQRDAPSSTR